MNITLPITLPYLIWETRTPGAHTSTNIDSALLCDPEYVLEIKSEDVCLFKANSSSSLTLVHKKPLSNFDSNPITALRHYLMYLEKTSGFFPTACGFLSYDAARYFEKIPSIQSHDFLPDLYVLINPKAVLPPLLESLPASLNSSNFIDFFSSQKSKEEFIKMATQSQEYIRAGDIYQVVLANSFYTNLKADPFLVYHRLKTTNPSPYHYFLSFPPYSYVGASPEVMLRTTEIPTGFSATMRPVAGTYPRISKDSANKLKNDIKEQAEHIMLVDHCRNDLGKVSKIGSVEVTDLLTVEDYPTLHHLVSGVTGTLKPECDYLDALEACFPIATLTGTPKIRAMEIIAELESPTRGIFGGCLFRIYDKSRLEATVAIRSALIHPNGAIVQAGAGIVLDSDPDREFNECLLKSNAVCSAIIESAKAVE